MQICSVFACPVTNTVLLSISFILICFLKRLLKSLDSNEFCIVQVPIYDLHLLVCIVWVPIYFRLLTITRWHNKAGVVAKTLAKSICLCLQLRQLNCKIHWRLCWLHQQLILPDILNFAWRNKFIDTFLLSLLTPIHKFLTFL